MLVSFLPACCVTVLSAGISTSLSKNGFSFLILLLLLLLLFKLLLYFKLKLSLKFLRSFIYFYIVMTQIIIIKCMFVGLLLRSDVIPFLVR
jgi:hypothetical protein